MEGQKIYGKLHIGWFIQPTIRKFYSWQSTLQTTKKGEKNMGSVSDIPYEKQKWHPIIL